MSRIIILGCGWSGILVAIRMKSLYPYIDVVCIDKNLDGGLLRSEVLKNYLFDVGGSHVVFSRRRDVVEGIVSMGGEWITRERASYVFLDGAFIPYPFENGIYVLPPEKRARYGLSLIKALMEYKGEKPASFKDWILRVFGRDIAEDYLIPYNEKIWKRPLDKITADWVFIPGRLPLPSLEDIVKAVAGLPTIGYKEQSVFYYPRRGGIMKQWEAARKYAESLGVRFHRMEVNEVKSLPGEYVINGVLKSDRIINALPLRDAPFIFDLSNEARRASERLDYNPVVVVGLGLRKQAPRQHWIYVPDKRVIFHRYAWISNYGEDMLLGKAVLIAEVTIPPTWKIDLEEVKSRVIHDLVEISVVKESEIDVAKAWFHRYGYPIYTLTHREDVDIITQELAQKGILTFGRWGNWQYWNTDKIYEESMKLEIR